MATRREPRFLAQRLAESVKRIRHDLGLSQEELAAACGLHRTYVGAIERAERNPSLATLEALSSGLGIDPSDLIAPDTGRLPRYPGTRQ